MRKVASANLREAAELYELDIPEWDCGTAPTGNVVVGKVPSARQKVAADSYSEAENLGRWFDVYSYSVPFESRRDVALEIKKRLDTQGLPTFGKTASYCGDGYGASFKGAMLTRKHLVTTPDAVEHVSYLIEKHAEFEPGAMVRILNRFDKDHGLTQLWDKKIPDPWATVYSAEHEYRKTASVSRQFLDKLVGHEGEVQDVFGSRFLDDLKKDPETVVAALPAPEREALQNMLG
jgi:hypothetical protein